MCVIVLKPKGKKVSKKDMSNCYLHNSDGCGVAVAEGDQLPIFRSMGSFDSFWNILESNQDKTCLIHFRIGTSGSIRKKLAHPFYLNGIQSLAFAHNGILSSYIPKEKDGDISDTMLFSKMVLEPLASDGERVLFNPVLIALISQHIGSMNKMVFLSKTGQYSIANESKGTWKKGVWFSNENWNMSRGFCWDDWSICSKPKTKKTRKKIHPVTVSQNKRIVDQIIMSQIREDTPEDVLLDRCSVCDKMFQFDEWETDAGLLMDGLENPICVDCFMA